MQFAEPTKPRQEIRVISATPRVRRLGVLLSGRGSNFLAIADAIAQGRLANASIAVVISNRHDALGIAAARSAGFATEVIEARGRKRAEQDAEIIASLKAHQVDLVCLAGYMRLLSAELVRAFPQRILNIHPSLLPAFPGLEAQRQALEYGVTVSGCTVHFVDEELDHGVIVLQKTVPVLAEDDEHTLATRILAQEHLAYAEAIDRVISGKYRFAGRRYVAVQTETE
jgi:phosphoribosylglycinamide formyltransferase-1